MLTDPKESKVWKKVYDREYKREYNKEYATLVEDGNDYAREIAHDIADLTAKDRADAELSEYRSERGWKSPC